MSVEIPDNPTLKRKAELNGAGRYEFGPTAIAPVAYQDINILRQVRTDFDPAGIAELAESMLVFGESCDTVVGFDMHNPIIVAKLDAEQASQYLKDHATFHKLKEPTPTHTAPDGFTYILIAGERRMLAIEKNIEDLDLDLGRVDVMSNVKHGIDFLSASHKQITENIYRKVSPVEEAVNIRKVYDYLSQRYPDKKVTVRDVSIMSGFTEGVIRPALAFSSLPEKIKELTKKVEYPYVSGGKVRKGSFIPLPYSVAVSLKPLEEAYRLKHARNEFEMPVDEYVEEELMATVMRIQEMRLETWFKGKSRVSDKVRKYIEESVKNVMFESQYTYDMDSFLIEETEEEKARNGKVQRARRHLAHYALHVIEFLRIDKTVDSDIARRLGDVYARVEGRDKAA